MDALFQLLALAALGFATWAALTIVCTMIGTWIETDGRALGCALRDRLVRALQ